MRVMMNNRVYTQDESDNATEHAIRKNNGADVNNLPTDVMTIIFGMFSPSYLFIAPVSKMFHLSYREFDNGKCLTDPSNISTKVDADMYLSESAQVFEVKEGYKAPDNITDIVVNDMVETIPRRAFEYCASLISVRLPDSLKVIGRFSFIGCRSLRFIVFPEGVKEICGGAFAGCTSLESIILPRSMKIIGKGAFGRCSSLKSVVIPEGVEKVDDAAFYGCTSLDSIRLPASIQKIGYQQ